MSVVRRRRRCRRDATIKLSFSGQQPTFFFLPFDITCPFSFLFLRHFCIGRPKTVLLSLPATAPQKAKQHLPKLKCIRDCPTHARLHTHARTQAFGRRTKRECRVEKRSLEVNNNKKERMSKILICFIRWFEAFSATEQHGFE